MSLMSNVVTRLELKTVHVYNFEQAGVQELVIYDDFDTYRSDGQFRKKTPGRVGKNSDEVSARDRGIAIARAKKTLRRVALHNQLTRLMTLTTQENIGDFERLDGLFKKFIFGLRDHYPDFKYIGVRERQKRGAVHYHLLINRYIPQAVAHKLWVSLVKKGTADFRFVEGLQAINYCLKYLGKSMEDPFVTKKGHNAKSYLCSTSLDRDFKKSRKVIHFYMQCLQDYFAYEDFLRSLPLSQDNVFFDKISTFDVAGETKECRSILLKTG
ncbi:hypothetical protein Dhaf_2701 [Desulfitobacterium hafniense DCB-2]|uniref:Replication-associated protein ORF2/G2P domain-containing protein n=1 Tax=Desulfitobacterium hafniense (strain DSM 10664 / DCB-2) TaxID=272564 RepID=B8FWB5_DESHD|nr:hypothetical protein [Desulfitobacterium hafniense]ACL20727.1 hypothetical protein Dhaf_2701 [Desulfitobacterium hafniense DCB-2]